jgi:hypothetical protein
MWHARRYTVGNLVEAENLMNNFNPQPVCGVPSPGARKVVVEPFEAASFPVAIRGDSRPAIGPRRLVLDRFIALEPAAMLRRRAGRLAGGRRWSPLHDYY